MYDAGSPGWAHRIGLWSLLLLLAGGAFWPLLTTPFVQDDYYFLERALEPDRLPESFTELRKAHSYRPLSTDVLFTGLFLLFGRSALPFHLAALLLHGGAACLLFGVLRTLGVPRGASLTGSVLFLFHPLCFWPLAWSSCMQELTATAAGFGALLIGLRNALAKRRTAYSSGAAGLLAIALLCKESALSYIAILAALLLLVLRTGFRPAVRLLLPSVLVTAAYLVLRFHLGDLPEKGNYRIELGSFAFLHLADHFAWAGTFLLAPLWIARSIIGGADGAFAADLPRGHPVVALLFFAFLALGWRRRGTLGLNRLIGAGILWWIFGLLPALFLPSHHFSYYGYGALGGLLLSAAPALACVRSVFARRRSPAVLACLLLMLGTHFGARAFRRDHFLPEKARLVESIGRGLRETVPRPPAGSTFYIAGLPRRSGWFVGREENSGSALRVFYRDLSLRSLPIPPGKPGTYRNDRTNFYWQYEDGRLRSLSAETAR